MTFRTDLNELVKIVCEVVAAHVMGNVTRMLTKTGFTPSMGNPLMPASPRNKPQNANKSAGKAITSGKYQESPSQKSTKDRKIKTRCENAIWSHDSLTVHAEELEPVPTSEGLETEVLAVDRDGESSPEILEVSAINYFS